MPLIAGIAIAGWTIAFAWVAISGPDVRDWTALISQWSVPVVLVIGLWLLVLRYSGHQDIAPSVDRPPVERSVDTAAKPSGSLGLLDEDPAAFEQRTQDRFATLRAQAERFKVELEAREQDNLLAIRRRGDELAKALSAQDIAMRTTAGKAMDEQQARFKAVREESLRLSGELEKVQADALRGWDSAVDELEHRMRDTLGKVVEVDEGALANVRARMAKLQEEAERIDADAGERLKAFDTKIAERRDRSIAQGNKALAALDDQLAAFDRRLDERREAQLGRIAELGERSEALAVRMGAIDGQLAGHVEQCEAASDALGRFAGDLADRLAQSRDLLETSGNALADMTSASETLFETIRSAADYSDKTIPAALIEATERLGTFETTARSVRDAILAAEKKAATLAKHLDRARDGVPVSADALDKLGRFAGDLSDRLTQSRDLLDTNGDALAEMTTASGTLFETIRAAADYSAKTIPDALTKASERLGTFETTANGVRDAIQVAEDKAGALVAHLDRAREGVPVSADTLDALGKRLEDLAQQSDTLARRTRQDLSDAMAELEGSSASMADKLRAGQEAALSEFAATFGERSLEVVGKGLREKTEAAIADLERTAQAAGHAGLMTVDTLRTQLAEVQDMAGNLEARVAQAREQAQQEPTKDFSIEMTKITERLNSAAIDVVKIFDADVSDVAWHAYMRGDYGTFTRKAVKLLPSQKAEAVYGYYRSDEAFRETVNRYIQDFESMVRVVLSTRNGHAMAVTLLSSDVGKLYVALAQATERLREK